MTDNQLAPTQSSPTIMGLIAAAIDKGIDADTMEKMLGMAERLDAERARREFDAAMAGFQSECPTIRKTKLVRTKGGDDAYRYTPIEKVVEQVKPLLIKYGFSHSVDEEPAPNGWVKVTTNVHHTGGHTRSTSLSVPLGTKTAVMSDTQVVMAAVTYAKRHSFCNAFGILTSDQDNDSRPLNEAKYFNVVKVVHDDANSRAVLYADNEILLLNRNYPPTNLPLEAPFRVSAVAKPSNEKWKYNGRDLPVYVAPGAELVEGETDG